MRVVITGGGTGGHTSAGLAVAAVLRMRGDLVSWVGSRGGIEARRAPEAGIAVEEDLATEVKKIAFTATAVGKYPIYCSKKLLFFASHRERGMEGVLEVVP